MKHYWLITFATYGSWLPGDRRGAERLRDVAGPPARLRRASERLPASPSLPLSALERYAALAARAGPVQLTQRRAELLFARMRRTVGARGGALLAIAVTSTRVRLVVGVPGDGEPVALLRELKDGGAQVLDAHRGRGRGRWWAAGGTRHRLATEPDVIAAMRAVRDQAGALLVWIDPAPPPGAGGADE